jgi:hypothetical protein
LAGAQPGGDAESGREICRLGKETFTLDSKRLADDPGRVMRVQGGRTRTTDGPYSETKEVLGGYYTIEADDYDGAVQRALDHPHLEYGGTIEVRHVYGT